MERGKFCTFISIKNIFRNFPFDLLMFELKKHVNSSNMLELSISIQVFLYYLQTKNVVNFP